MNTEQATPQLRERYWIEKYDHTTDPPTLVETVFVENGVVRQVTAHAPDGGAERRDDSG